MNLGYVRLCLLKLTSLYAFIVSNSYRLLFHIRLESLEKKQSHPNIRPSLWCLSIQSIPICIFHDINSHKNNILHKDKSHKKSIHCRILLHPFHSSSSPRIVSCLPTRKLASNKYSIQTSVDYIGCPKQPARMIRMVCFVGNWHLRTW